MTDYDEFVTVKIFGHNIHRIFRDDKKNIICIVLEKDGVYREFKYDNDCKKIEEKID